MRTHETVPVIRVGSNLLISLQGDMDDATVLRVESHLTREVARIRATGVLIEVSGLSVIDSFVARVLTRIVAMIRLLGAVAVVVGIQPAVAITLVELGMPMQQIHTALNADQGIALLQRLMSDANSGDIG